MRHDGGAHRATHGQPIETESDQIAVATRQQVVAMGTVASMTTSTRRSAAISASVGDCWWASCSPRPTAVMPSASTPAATSAALAASARAWLSARFSSSLPRRMVMKPYRWTTYCFVFPPEKRRFVTLCGSFSRNRTQVQCGFRPVHGAARCGAGSDELKRIPAMQASRDIARLIEIMAALRTPGTGCPWDLEQDFRDHRALHDRGGLRGCRRHRAGRSRRSARGAGRPAAAGRLYARMAQEDGAFDFGDVVEAITEKMIRRHPHVFGDARGLAPGRVKTSGTHQGRGKGAQTRQRRRRKPARWPGYRSACLP